MENFQTVFGAFPNFAKIVNISHIHELMYVVKLSRKVGDVNVLNDLLLIFVILMCLLLFVNRFSFSLIRFEQSNVLNCGVEI